MLAALEKEKYRNKKIVAFKPKLDHRYGDCYISTHTGYTWEAINVSTGEEILRESDPAICETTGRDAYYTVRISTPGKEIEVGGAETYQPRSWAATPFMKKYD